MTVQIGTERKAAWITWDAAASDSETVTLRASTHEGGDVSTTNPMPNDGLGGALTYPVDHHGTTRVEVLDADGNVFDEGEIEV